VEGRPVTVDLTPFTPTGPANSETDETTGDRWYYFEQYGRLMSVTTAFRSIAKSGLVIWSAIPRRRRGVRGTPHGRVRVAEEALR
jgi:hypothetical protein